MRLTLTIVALVLLTGIATAAPKPWKPIPPGVYDTEAMPVPNGDSSIWPGATVEVDADGDMEINNGLHSIECYTVTDAAGTKYRIELPGDNDRFFTYKPPILYEWKTIIVPPAQTVNVLKGMTKLTKRP